MSIAACAKLLCTGVLDTSIDARPVLAMAQGCPAAALFFDIAGIRRMGSTRPSVSLRKFVAKNIRQGVTLGWGLFWFSEVRSARHR